MQLFKALAKDDIDVKEDKFNKILLDLEILGLIHVAWMTKDTRRVELAKQEQEKDAVEEQNKQTMEKEYEASFPGADD